MTINELVEKLEDLANKHSGDTPVCIEHEYDGLLLLYSVFQIDTIRYGDQPLTQETDPLFDKTVVRLR